MSVQLAPNPMKPTALQLVGHMLRSIWTGPFSLDTVQKDSDLKARFLPGGSSSDPIVTIETAMMVSAVWDAVSQLSGDVAGLPLVLYKRDKEGRKQKYTESKLFKLLHDEPNTDMTSFVLRRVMMLWALVSKGAYAEIERDGVDRPVAFWPITPSWRVEPFRERLVTGQWTPLRYRVDGTTVLDGRDVIHIHGIGEDGKDAFPLIHYARKAIGLALSAEANAGTFFQSGSNFGGILFNEDTPDPDQESALRKNIATYQAEASRTQKFLMLFGAGWKYERTGVNPKDSSLKEIREQQVEEIARFFGMPLHKLKVSRPGAVSYASVEMADLDYYKGSLLRWITPIEQEFNRKLVPALEYRRQFIKHNADAFLRGDAKTRAEALEIQRKNGIINGDEWRDFEDMNALPAGQGELYLVQNQSIPLSRINDVIDKQVKSDTPPPTPGSEGEDRGQQIADLEARLAESQQACETATAEAQREREHRMAAEATGTATAEELSARQVAEREATERAEQAEALVAARDADLVSLRAQIEADVEARTAVDTARAVAEAARQVADQRAEQALADAQLARQAQAQAVDDMGASRAREQEARAAAEAAERLATEARADAAAAQASRAEADAARTEAERVAAEARLAADEAATQWVEAKAAAESAEQRAAEARAALAIRDAPCGTCNNVGLLPERHMGDPQGQLPCPECEAGARVSLEIQAKESKAAADAAEALRLEAKTVAERAMEVVEDTRVESARLVAEAQAKAVDEAEQRAAEAQARTEAERLATDAVARAEAARVALEQAQETARQADADRVAAIARAEQAQAAHEQEAAARAEAETKATDAERLATEARAMAEAAQVERERLAAQSVDTVTRLEAARQTAADSAEQAHAAQEQEAAARADAERQASEARTSAESEAVRVADLERQLTEVRQAHEAAEARLVEGQQAREAIESELRLARQSDADGAAAIIASHRRVVVGIMQRMIERETDRARRAQATPDKLRAWVDHFYDGHEDLCRRALEDAVRVHCAFIRSVDDPSEVTRRLVQMHVTDSVRQIRSVLDGDADEIGASFPALLNRWDTERAAVIADLLMQKEIEYVRQSR